jgi:hypothetical protein
MTITANMTAFWRRIVDFIQALEQVELGPHEEQHRRIASLEKRIAILEAANH